LEDLDDALGEGAIHSGDVIVFTGESGTLKTDIGLLFSLGLNNALSAPISKSLIVPLREPSGSVKRSLARLLEIKANPKKDIGKFIFKDGLASGYIQPGRIMQAITDAFESVEPDKQIDRVFIDDVGLWDLNCPFVKGEVTFIQTLIQYLRNKNAVSLFSLPSTYTHEDVVHASVLSAADVHVHFRLIPYQNGFIPMLNVKRSRSTSAKPGMREIQVTPDAIRLCEATVHVPETGAASPYECALYFHEENRPQKLYNEFITETLQREFGSCFNYFITPFGSRLRLDKMQNTFSANRIQIEQIDEFQLKSLDTNAHDEWLVHRFSRKALGSLVDEWTTEDQQRLLSSNDEVRAIPLYDNRAFFVYAKQAKLDSVICEWKKLVNYAKAWEEKNAGVFFAFDTHSPETYNTLLLEIFLGIGGRLPVIYPEAWPRDPRFAEALRLLIPLCARWGQHVRLTNQPFDQKATVDPIIWRTWYSSAHCEALRDWRLNHPGHKYAPLPKNIAVSGEWYFIVPTHSVLPERALDIIRSIVGRTQQLERLNRGVGLPVFKSYFEEWHGGVRESSSLTSFVKRLGSKSVRRSDIPHYSKFSGILANHLQEAVFRGADVLSPDAFSDLVDTIGRDILFAITER
jgi:KaiC/GvpD/RAD55 family RecA-like ATPase